VIKKIKKSKINKKKIAFFLIKWGFISCIWLIIAIISLFVYYSTDLPDIEPIINEKKDANFEILYSNENELKMYGNSNSDITNYAEFPFYLIDALAATEDKKFFKHHGFDYLGIIRAIISNIRAGYIKEGGSTITQQLSKTILKNSKKTYNRKIKELILAIQLERKLSKDEILTMYLNKSYFGAGKYGIKQASKFYFGKKVSHLNLEESAMLVGLLKAPSKYSPQNNPILSKERTKQVITNMYNAKVLSKEKYVNYLKNYISEIVNASETNDKNLNYEYYFADWVKSQLEDYTKKTNIRVITTLDERIQKIVEDNIIEFKIHQKDKLKNSQVAVVVIAKDGAVLGMIGGLNYNLTEFNRVLYAYRQAGSIFKLFVFLAGIREKGWNIDTTFIDEPIAVGNWYPKNYGEKYYGQVTMKEAFYKSLNSVAVQISEYAGIKNVVKIAKKMGVLSEMDKDDPTIALGTTQVNLLELTSAYSVITNNGDAVIPYSILKIKNLDDNNLIYKRKTEEFKKILEKEEIENIKDMMFNVITNGTGKNAKIEELINKGSCCIGGKTGTSQNYSDAWFIGYANDITIGIWIGNDDNTSMEKTTGGTLPAILWRNIAKNINNLK
jgi:penicillin-binding protein 1A